jgi:TonB family protein
MQQWQAGRCQGRFRYQFQALLTAKGRGLIQVKRYPILLSFFIFLVSCSHRQSSVAPPAIPLGMGEVSYKFLPEDKTGGQKDPQGWEYQAPRLMGGPPLPIYPERPLAARFGQAVVIVRITIAPEGTVTDVSAKPGSTPGRFAEDFFQAVDSAVRKWKFTPPQWWLLEEGKDINNDGKPDYQKVVRIDHVSVSGDVEFQFDLKNPQATIK